MFMRGRAAQASSYATTGGWCTTSTGEVGMCDCATRRTENCAPCRKYSSSKLTNKRYIYEQ